MRSKKKINILVMIYLIVLAITIKIFPLENSKMGLMNAIDDVIQTYQETVTQEPVSNITDKMYVTLINDKHQVIGTTNPNTKVDTTNKIALTDNISILFEIPETKDNTIKEDIYYYLDLPEYIIPKEENVIGTEKGPEGPIDLISSTNIKAVGGIYKDGNKYKFKIKFSDTKDELDIKATYQFGSKLSKDSAPNEGLNDVNLNFGLAGIIKVVVDIPITPVAKNTLELDVSGEWKKTNIGTNTADAIWTTTITDNRNEKHIPAGTKLSLNFPGECSVSEETINDPKTNCIATVVTSNNKNNNDKYNDSPLQIYADGQKLEYTRDENTKWTYQVGDTTLTLDVSNLPAGTADIISSHSVLIRSLDITFNGDINDIKDWKFVLLGETYNIDDSKNFTLNTKLTGVTDDSLTDSATVVKNIGDFTITQGVTNDKEDACLRNGNCPIVSDGNDMPIQLTYDLKTDGLKTVASKYIKLEVEPSFANTYDYADWYAYTMPFNFPHGTNYFKELINSFKIDGKEIDLNSGTFISSTLEHQLYMFSQLPEYSLIFSQLFKWDYYSTPFYYQYIRGTTGEPYYISIAPEVYEMSGGTHYANFWNPDTQKPLKWNIYIFGVDGHEVEIQYSHHLGKINIDTSENLDVKSHVLNKTTVSTSYNSATTVTEYKGKIPNDLAVKTGSYTANNIVKWNVDVDNTKLVNKYWIDSDNGAYFGISTMFLQMYDNQNLGIIDDYLSNLKHPNMAPTLPEKFEYIFQNNAYLMNNHAFTNKTEVFVSGNYNFKTNLTEEVGYKIMGSSAHIAYYDYNNNHSKFSYYTYFNESSSLMEQNHYIKEKTELMNFPSYNLGVGISGPSDPNNFYRIKTTGVVPTAQLSKSHVSTKTITNDRHNQITTQVWNIHADTNSYDEETDKTYYYNGHIDISDDMSSSTISSRLILILVIIILVMRL